MRQASNVSSLDGTIAFRGHIAELDALRAIGTALVITDHFWPKRLSLFVFSMGQCGWIAMDSFFVMSGFLITGILLDTSAKPRNLRNYYIRRSLRIFPLYYLVLLSLAVMMRLSHEGGAGAEYRYLVQHWGSPAWFAVYLGNFRTAYIGRWPSVFAFVPLWSLQVEEQFYLLFPLAVLWMRRKHLSRVLWLLVLLSPLFRVLTFLWNPSNSSLQYVLLPCHMDGLALGALIAIRLRGGPWNVHKPTLTVLTIGLLSFACAGSVMSKPVVEGWAWSSPFNRLVGYSLSSWGCACLILWLILFRDSAYTRWSRFAPLQYIGKISYGIYLLHPIAFRLLLSARRFGIHLRSDGFPRFATLIVLTLLMASVSWYVFERPILSLKERLTAGKKPHKQVDSPPFLPSPWPERVL